VLICLTEKLKIFLRSKLSVRLRLAAVGVVEFLEAAPELEALAQKPLERQQRTICETAGELGGLRQHRQRRRQPSACGS